MAEAVGKLEQHEQAFKIGNLTMMGAGEEKDDNEILP